MAMRRQWAGFCLEAAGPVCGSAGRGGVRRGSCIRLACDDFERVVILHHQIGAQRREHPHQLFDAHDARVAFDLCDTGLAHAQHLSEEQYCALRISGASPEVFHQARLARRAPSAVPPPSGVFPPSLPAPSSPAAPVGPPCGARLPAAPGA